ncbi:MAG TPA: hypothetical protein VJH20_00505, partial [Candidatus Nanoarchaeia archaeon]|nr:hypothetical protein [Candidatus Nanoarchaeia archaeon]
GQWYDQLAIAYLSDVNNPVWQTISTGYCPGQNQYYNYSVTFNLANNNGSHVIRGIVGDYVNPNTYCGAYIYDDNDDVVVNVISEPRGTGSPMFLKAIQRNIDREFDMGV